MSLLWLLQPESTKIVDHNQGYLINCWTTSVKTSFDLFKPVVMKKKKAFTPESCPLKPCCGLNLWKSYDHFKNLISLNTAYCYLYSTFKTLLGFGWIFPSFRFIIASDRVVPCKKLSIKIIIRWRAIYWIYWNKFIML